MNWLLAALAIMAMGMGTASCSSDNGDDEKDRNFSQQLYGKVWTLDGKKGTTVRFFRNHLVEYNGGTSVSSGALAGGSSLFFGTWQATDSRLTTTFTSGTTGGFDWNSILYGTLTLKEVTDKDRIVFTAPDNTEHDLMHLSTYSDSKTFTDYTDDTQHDKALHGTWHATAYIDNRAVEYTITVSKDGTARWQQPDNGIDFTSTYTTKNGHVTVDHILVPNSSAASYIYIREEKRILFYTEDYAMLQWSWTK